MHSREEYDGLLKKAKGFGIDFEVVMDEISRRNEKAITTAQGKLLDTIQGILVKFPTVEQITAAVMDQLAGQAFPIDDIAKKVAEIIPSSEAVEIKQIETKLTNELRSVLTKIQDSNAEMIRQSVENIFTTHREALIQDVRTAAEKVFDQKAAAAGGSPAAPSSSTTVERVIDLILKKAGGDENPLASLNNALDMVSSLQQRMAALNPGPGVDPNIQYRTNQQIYLEGIKVGAKINGGSQPKKSFGPPAGPSIKPASPFSVNDPVVAGLSPKG
jgi:hypothetical protein